MTSQCGGKFPGHYKLHCLRKLNLYHASAHLHVPACLNNLHGRQLEALDAENIMGREASDASRPPVGENTERCMHRRVRMWWFVLHLVQVGGAVCLNAQLQGAR